METSSEQITVKLPQQDIILSSGKLAKQANGSVLISCGGTVVLVTACMSKDPKKDYSFFPLFVEYREKTYAAGKIPGGFFKREGRPTDREILSARMIDRSIRPLFPKGFAHEVQVMGLVLSSDGENDPDILAINGASLALHISDIPYFKPVAACRVVKTGDNFIVNPTYEQREASEMDLVIAGSNERIVMLEASADEVKEEDVQEAIFFAQKYLSDILNVQNEFSKKFSKKKAKIELMQHPAELIDKIKEASMDRLNKINAIADTESRQEEFSKLSDELVDKFPEEQTGASRATIVDILSDIQAKLVKSIILNEKRRLDGRGYDDIRPIQCEVGILPHTHGSALFTRGNTQSLAVTTLGTSVDEQMIEALEGKSYKKFMLHYSFPPFSVGEVKPVRGPGRREVGHGMLAEKAIAPTMPSAEDFPYTVRVVSEVLESNGSSSMATVCASSMSLMDTGVKISSAVAGVALGLITEGDKFVLLTDIAGLEDHCGDMDFKMAGTRQGVTAVQLDVKFEGLTTEMLKAAFIRSKEARKNILDAMELAISKPRENISKQAPRITIFQVAVSKIGDIIGPGGKTIRGIIKETEATIDIDDNGSVTVASTNEESSEKAIEMIRGIVREAKLDEIFEGTITKVTDFGAFCKILPNKEGLIHVSELSSDYVKRPQDVIKVGDKVKVKVIGIDELGKVKLSKKRVDEDRQG